MEQANNLKYRFISMALLGLMLIATYLVYQPGLSGGLTFDDYHSLEKLAVFEGDITGEKLIKYLGQSDTGVLKRPISIYSFLIDAQDWPTEAYSFKRTNLMIHLLNGALLFMLLQHIFSRHKKHQAYRLFLAYMATAIWLLHPFLVSTTLYVVQRMAMLPLTFMLLCMLMYVLGRFRYDKESSKKNQLVLIGAVWGGTLLAMLSKENGVLLLPMMALFEVFIIQKYLKLPALSKNFKRLLLTLPIVLLVCAFLFALPSFLAGYDIRDFTAYERQLTQFRVLTDYLYHLFVPEYFSHGVFTDGFPYSHGWLQPVSTVFSGLFILALLLLAWFQRNRWVWFSFAVFFFFIAHSLESTVIPLEMYFEHRNYVASLFLAVPLLLLIIKLFPKRHVHWTMVVLIVLYLMVLTSLRTHQWSDAYKLNEMTLEKYPESVRIYTSTAQYYAKSGYTEQAIMILNQGIARHDDLHLKLNKIYLYCEHPSMTDEKYGYLFGDLFESFQTVPFMQGDIPGFTIFFRNLTQNKCGTGHDALYAKELYKALFENPHKDRQYLQILIHAYGMFYNIEKDQFDQAAENIKVLIRRFGFYGEALNGIRLLLSKNQYQIAQNILLIFKKDYDERFRWKLDFNYFGQQIDELIDLAEEDIEEHNMSKDNNVIKHQETIN